MSSTAGPIVVGIGSSAGGLEALESLFRATPARTGLAYVVVTHLAVGQKSALPEILARYTVMPVTLAHEGDAVRADQVYVAPADASLTIDGGKLCLHRIQGARHVHHPIDTFLASLAEDQGERAVAVILSGAGSDGALGLTAVKEQGGLTIAQGSAHTTPRYPGMPSNAIATGFVDLILPAEEIPAKLLEYVRSFDALAPVLANDPPIQARDKTVVRPQEAISAILLEQLRHDFSAYKDKTFLRRVQRRMQVLQLNEVEAYVALLRQDNGEAKLLFRDLLINVTGFFRDTESFEALEQQVIPKLFEGKDAGDSVRVWIPGCATGEEAYSIAILLHEHLDKLNIAPRVQIFASDIDEAALDAARAGRYVAASMGSVTPERRDRYFTTDGAIYAVAKSVRDMCIFSLHSVIRDPPFSHLDLISCRNLLIYLNIDAQTRLLPVFHYALRPKGYLFLGSAEGVGQQADLFLPVDKKSRLFQRRESIGRTPPRFPLSVPEPRLGSFGGGGHYRRDYAAEPAVQRAVEAALLGSLAPAHVVINEDGEAVYYSSRIGKYLGPAPGFPNRQVLPMARKGLRLDLRLAMDEAVASRRAITRERVALELDGNLVQFVNVTVAPLPNQERGGTLFLILFIDLGQPVPVEQVTAAARDGQPSTDLDTGLLIAQLERELKDTRDRLQATIEEHEIGLEEVRSTNEELVSLNEELQSTNEELETSKEEIQSVNEELNTVNQELSNKVDQLNLANADLKNLFDGTRIAVVFLDHRLVVRNFTPAATNLFNLIASDRGRPLTDITGHVNHPGLQDDLRQVLALSQPVERRVSRHDGQAHYLMRILPYRDGGMVEGVIVTFVDVTALSEAERQQQVMIHELNHRVRNVLAVVAVIARQTLATGGAPAGIEEVLSGRIGALGRAYGLVTRERWGAVAFEEVIQEELKPHLDGNESRFTAKGPRVMLNSKSAVAFGLVLHELATNAIKHGALSTAEGRITVEWRVEERDDGRWLLFDWQEVDGPEVRQPVKKGFGSRLIETEICHDLQGEVRTEFREAGVLVSLSVPLIPPE